ncbi:putative lipase [Rhodococcoides trifolii]|uniref:Lipase n=1 Tax=Rhodococcoides trifolii TaxID=908250 RepID=A0A917LIX0_9NOCA|nr:lipase family protein [Rhodococcus trifolii]GGG28012.1 putative lipase [Rhodococcus trifolii]
MTRRLVPLLAACALFVTVSACSSEPEAPAAPTPEALPSISDAALAARGTVLSSTPLDLAPEVAARVGSAERVVYNSVSPEDGASTEVSGTVFLPKGTAPEGGWPVLSYGHPTTGTDVNCGPSLYQNLLGSAETIAAIVESGTAVAMTDYEGLGQAGAHPYLEPRAAAFNMIDAVRALRNTYPTTSTRWLALGGSQGGAAAWAADEYAGDYGSGLDFLGAVAVSPPAEITGLAQAAKDGTLTPAQVQIMPLVIAGLKAVHPDLVLSDYLSGVALDQLAVLGGCDPAQADAKSSANAALDGTQVVPVSQEATDQLKTWLGEYTLPKRPASGPLLVINGGKDDLVLQDWVESAVQRACTFGDPLLHRVNPDQGHSDADGGDEMYKWILDRLTDKRAPSNCA